MARTIRLTTAGGTALIAGIVLMIVLHQIARRSFGAGFYVMEMHAGISHEMPWFVSLGPLAMALSLGGLLMLFVSFVRWAARKG